MSIAEIGKNMRRHLELYTFAAVAAGLATSRVSRGVSLKYLIPFALFVMLYPAFLEVEWEKITEVMAKPRALSIAMLINLILSPVLMYGFTSLFSAGMDSGLIVGLLIFGMIPAGGMGPAYTKMMDGNVNLAVAISSVSLLLSLATIPLWSSLLIGRILTVPIMLIFQYLLMIIVGPLIVAALTRGWVVRSRGMTAFIRFKELLQSTSVIGHMFLLFAIFVLNGNWVMVNPSLIMNLLFPTVSFSLLLLVGSTRIGRAGRLPYEDSVALTISSTLKNTAIAMALATSIFHGREALAIGVAGPLVQFPVMLSYMKIVRRFSLGARPVRLGGSSSMETVAVRNEVEFNADGYLLNPEDWTEELARRIAGSIGLESLSENHWAVIRYVRWYWEKNRTSPLISQISRSTRLRLEELGALFPMGLARGACRIAGLPKPDGCV